MAKMTDDDSKAKKRAQYVMGAEYYEKFYQQTYQEWQKFVEGNADVDASIVSRELLDSWKRCRELAVDPHRSPENQVLSGEDLFALLAKNREFIDASRPFMKNLYSFLEGSGFLVSLFDRDAFILEVIGDLRENRILRNAWGFVGACWNEANSGNTAAGTVVVSRKPIQVFAAQHYIRFYHDSTGSGAPIFDPDGALLGGIALSARYYRANPHTLGMAVAAAQAIENELRIRRALAESRVAYSYQKTVISSIQGALIAVDGEGRVTLINDNARKMLALGTVPAEGRKLRDLFGHQNHHFFTLLENNDTLTDTEVRIVTQQGGGDFTLTSNPILAPGGESIGRVIVLSEIQRARSMVTKMMGAKANLRFEDMRGQNPRFLMTVDQAKMVAQSRSNVLLLGKSGTGKDIFAQSIHNASDRQNGPYVAINCGAIPRDLIASELFGHEEGAFTGSRRGGNQGKFELADGGTIFLDEIAETPLELQTALLRVMEDKSVLRIGGTRVRPVDVRIIAATNKDLREEVRKGNFREDLYYRANVFAIEMVPLCDRLDDIPLLTDHFIKQCASAMKKNITRVDKKVLDIFMNYSWPGNVRELQNAIERMVNFLKSTELTAEMIPDHIQRPRQTVEVRDDMISVDETQRRTIEKMLAQKFRRNQIAARLNISRATLYRKIKQYGLE